MSDGSFPQMDRILRGAAEEKNVLKAEKEHDIQGQGAWPCGAERSSLCEMIVGGRNRDKQGSDHDMSHSEWFGFIGLCRQERAI